MIEVSRGRYKILKKKINLPSYSNSNQSFEPSSMGSIFNMNNFMKKSNVKKLENDWKWLNCIFWYQNGMIKKYVGIHSWFRK